MAKFKIGDLALVQYEGLIIYGKISAIRRSARYGSVYELTVYKVIYSDYWNHKLEQYIKHRGWISFHEKDVCRHITLMESVLYA